MTDQPTDEGTSAGPTKIFQNIAEPDRPTENVGVPPKKPRIIKYEARAGDMRLTYSLSEAEMATTPPLMELLMERLAPIMLFAAWNESTAAHLLGDLQGVLDEFNAIYAEMQRRIDHDAS